MRSRRLLVLPRRLGARDPHRRLAGGDPRRVQPAAQLAYDLADFAQACTLAERELASDYGHLYNISALSAAGQRILRESLERGEELLRLSLAHLGRDAERAAIRARASLAAAHKTHADVATLLATQPGSRSLKSMIKQCEAVIANAGAQD